MAPTTSGRKGKYSVPGATGFGGNARGSFAQELVEANDGGSQDAARWAAIRDLTWKTSTCPVAALPSPAAPRVRVLRRVAGVIVGRRGQRLDRFALADRLPPVGGRSSACLPVRFRRPGPIRCSTGVPESDVFSGVCETTERDSGRPPRTR